YNTMLCHLVIGSSLLLFSFFFFLYATPPTQIYTLSLHDALPISAAVRRRGRQGRHGRRRPAGQRGDEDLAERPRGHDLRRRRVLDRKSTRLNSSHVAISYAVFCLKKKKSAHHRR